MAEQFNSEQSNKKKSPVLAAFLAIIPGLGSIYNGNIIKAFGVVIVFILLIVMLATNSLRENAPFMGIFLGIFYIYQLIDSYNEASRNRISPVNNKMEAPEKVSLFWALLVLGLGIVFQLANFGLIRHRDIIRFSPVLLIFFGIKLIVDYFYKEKEGHDENR